MITNKDMRILIAIVAAVGLVVVLLVAAILVVDHVDPIPAAQKPVQATLSVAGMPGPGTTDQELVNDLNAICAEYTGGCHQRITVAMLPGVVSFVCEAVAQTDVPEPVDNPAWVAAWDLIGPMMVGSGRCNGS